jgi:hypothetical protein
MRPPSSRPAANFARHGIRHNVNLPRPSWRCASPSKDEPRKNVHPCQALAGAADRCWCPSEKPPSGDRLEDRVRGSPTALLHKGLAKLHRLHRWSTFSCKTPLSEWAMLVSNQRPLPCESEPRSFATVRRHPIPAFLSRLSRYFYRGRSPTCAPVVVKLSSEHRLPKLWIPSYLYAPECVEGEFFELRFDGVLRSSHRGSVDGIMLGGGKG